MKVLFLCFSELSYSFLRLDQLSNIIPFALLILIMGRFLLVSLLLGHLHFSPLTLHPFMLTSSAQNYSAVYEQSLQWQWSQHFHGHFVMILFIFYLNFNSNVITFYFFTDFDFC